MKNKIIDYAVYILFACFFLGSAFLVYPKPSEIILLEVGGLLFFLISGACYKKWEKTLTANTSKRQQILKSVLPGILMVSWLAVMFVFRTSWWEGKIILNITQSDIGIFYLGILISVIILVIFISCIQYRRSEYRDIGIHNKSEKKEISKSTTEHGNQGDWR